MVKLIGGFDFVIVGSAGGISFAAGTARFRVRTRLGIGLSGGFGAAFAALLGGAFVIDDVDSKVDDAGGKRADD